MRCPTCEHENPKNAPRCEACGAALVPGAGAAPVNPGRKLTAFEPAPFLPHTAPTPPLPSGALPPLPLSGTGAGAGAVPTLSPLPPAATPFPPPAQGRRTVAEPASVLPPPGSSLPGLPPHLHFPVPVPGHAPPASPSLQTPLAPPVTGAFSGRIEATRLAQSPDVGGAPQLRGALFEYRGLGHHGFIHTLRSGRNVLGRDPGVCDVVLEEDRASKQHAYLFIRDEDVSYLDISTNGSVVDGRPVHGTEVRLNNPSVIQVGGLRLVFVFLPRRLVDGLP